MASCPGILCFVNTLESLSSCIFLGLTGWELGACVCRRGAVACILCSRQAGKSSGQRLLILAKELTDLGVLWPVHAVKKTVKTHGLAVWGQKVVPWGVRLLLLIPRTVRCEGLGIVFFTQLPELREPSETGWTYSLWTHCFCRKIRQFKKTIFKK